MKTMYIRMWTCLLFLAAVCSLSAQEFTGRVTDPTGAVVPKVVVTAHNVDTGVDIKTTTNGSGSYTIPYLHYGNYTVTAEKDGFKAAAQTGINLHVYETSVVNFTLQVGKVTETITVSADTLLDAGKADEGEVVENTRVTELPLNGRDPMMLSELAAGVNYNYSGYTRPFDDTQQYTSINGGGTGNVELLLDGTSNNASPINVTGGSTDYLAQTGYTTPVDAVQEFKLVTSPYDATYGLNSGGVEDVILKSGTNTIHGDAYEFMRRTWLDANSWQNDYYYATKKAQGASASTLAAYKTPVSHWDQYGFELDGPIVVPKIYNGKNKSFFTMQWEHFHALSPLTDGASVPDADWASGDFSNLDHWDGSQYVPRYIFNPQTSVQDTTATSSTHNDWTRQQFDGSTPTQVLNSDGSLKSLIGNTQTGNVIPSSQMDKMAQTIMKMYPHCYKTGTSFLTGAKSDPNCVVIGGSQDHWSNNYVLSTTGIDTYNNILLKWDQHWTNKDRSTLRYGYWMWNNTYNGNGMPAPLTTGAQPKVERSHTFALEEVHTFTPNLLLDFKSNVIIRENLTRNGATYDMTNLGWTQSEVNSMGTAAGSEFPYLCWQDNQYGCYYSSYTTVGSTSNVEAVKNSMNVFPGLTWIKGKHTIHGGIDIRLWQNTYPVLNGGPTINTGGNWTSYTANHAAGISDDGETFASFLMGVPWDARNQIWPQTFQSEHYFAPFIQDDWKVTRKLTLNLGLRWDWLPAEVERNNKGNYAFDTASVNPYLTSVQISGHGTLTGGVTFVGVNGNPRGSYATENFNYQPRFGFAYALNNKTVLRGGFGKSMQAPQNGIPVNGFSASTVGTTSDPSQGSGIFPNTQNKLENLFWGGVTGSVQQPTGTSLGLGTSLGQGFYFYTPHTKTPSFWSYSLGFERQLGNNSTVNVSYVGSRLYNGTSSSNINLQDNSLRKGCSPLYGGDPNNCSDQNSGPGQKANPFYGMSIFAGSGYNTNTYMSNLDLSRPYPQFGDLTRELENDARTWYNSLQITALHKFSNTLTLHGTDTWSKSMDAGSWTDQNYGIRARHVDSSDIANRITLSGVLTLPIGRGRLLLPNANRIVDEAIGGWELSGMAILQSGMPQSVPTYYLHNAKVKRHIDRSSGNPYIRVFAPYAEHYVLTNNKYVVQPYEGNGVTYAYDGTNPGYANFMDVPSYAPSQDVGYSGIREAGVRQFDTSFSKNFAIHENLKLQIRMDAFNVLNHPEWTGGANTTTSDANLGVINKGPTGSSINPRHVQLSAKIVW
jgi:hypothetical protein